jgi:hypothetical protein
VGVVFAVAAGFLKALGDISGQATSQNTPLADRS